MADFVAKALAKSIGIVRRTVAQDEKTEAMEWSLHDGRGRRKYLVSAERTAFLEAAIRAGGETATFCLVLGFCGCRISEALALTPERIDDANCAITFETLKRRRKGIMRTLPVPRRLLRLLQDVHHYREAQAHPARARARLWRFSRTTGWRRVKAVMQRASIPAFLTSPKALRHAFAAEASTKDVVLAVIQKWLGHADIRTTAIYTTLIGGEERALASRTWLCAKFSDDENSTDLADPVNRYDQRAF